MTLERGTLLHKRYGSLPATIIASLTFSARVGMGFVYRAIDENLGVEVAVKENFFTTDEYARQFRLEAVILANLRHPNLPRVTDHFVIGEQGQYLVMDYIPGEDLRQRMERLGMISEEEALLIGAAMGDAAAPGRVSLTECWYDNPHSGQTSIRVAYTPEVIGWAGLYWVHPAENWGDRPGGYDLTGADRLTFWARSDTPNARVTFLVGGIGYPVDYQGNPNCSNPSEPYPDSVCPKIQQSETLFSTWTKYTIPLPQSRDLSKVVGGFGWVAESPVTFYLDDVVYEFDQIAEK